MARRARTFSTQAVADTALPLATETVVATTPPLIGEYPDSTVRFLGVAAVTGGAGSTNVTLRVRRDGVAGAIVGEAVVTQDVGAVLVTASIAVEENRVGLGGQVYVLTATQAGGASTCTMAELIALVA